MSTDTDQYTTGIYLITNVITNTVYVGSTTRLFRERWGQHKNELRRGVHGNRHIQRAWNRDGADAFVFSVLEVVTDRVAIIVREQYWIDQYLSLSSVSCYNMSPIANSVAGRITSPETRRKLSQIAKGRINSAETRAKLSLAGKGRRKTEEHRRKIGDAHRGVPRSEQSRLANIAAQLAYEHKPYKTYTGFIAPDGQVYRDILDLQAFCKEHKLGYAKMVSINSGKLRSHRKWVRLCTDGFVLPEKKPIRYLSGDEHYARQRPHLVPRGEQQGRAKLTEANVREIRALYATGKYKQQELADRFGVTQGLIGHIIRRVAWKHI